MTLKNFLNKILSSTSGNEKEEDVLKPLQNILIRVKNYPHTFITRVEDIDKDSIHVAAINAQELEYHVPIPNEKIELFILTETRYCRTEVVFKKWVQHPLNVWILSRPKKISWLTNKRRLVRVESILEAKFRLLSEVHSDWEKALTKNISIGGVAFVSSTNMRCKLKIQLTLPEISQRVFNAEIVWRYKRPNFDKWIYGVKFTDEEEEKFFELSSYVSKRSIQARIIKESYYT